MSHVTHYKRVPIWGLVLAIATLIALAVWPAGWSLAGICAMLMFIGIGIGTMYPLTTVVIQNAVEPYQFGTATGTLDFFRQLGGTTIVAVFVAIVLGGGGMDEGAPLAATADAAHDAPLFRLVFIAAAVFLSRRWGRLAGRRAAAARPGDAREAGAVDGAREGARPKELRSSRPAVLHSCLLRRSIVISRLRTHVCIMSRTPGAPPPSGSPLFRFPR